MSQKPDGSLSLTDLPPADLTNTVHFARLLPLCSVKTDNQVTSDGQNNEWVQITAGNAQGQPISGWVNISKDSHGNFPPHIKRVSPWEWTDFNPIEETANVANMVEKSRDNRRMTLNLADYTESMTALHHILTLTPLNKAAELAAELPSFTDKQLKAGLRTPWTSEQIGRLLVKYESEWYADESLSKWNEIDSLYQNQYDQKKQSIADELTQANITKPAERDYAMQILDKSYQQQTDEWQIEKQQRIKPSLWWREVAEGQAAITPASTESAESPETTPQPVLSNLCATGKVWHLHPVEMFDFSSFNVTEFSSRGIDFLKIWEGSRLKPYDDQTGKTITQYTQGATIGVGHLITSKDEFELYKNGVNDTTVDDLLYHDLHANGYIQVVIDAVKIDLTQNEFDALVVFAFNIGVSGFKNSTVVKMINNPEKSYGYSTLEEAWLPWSKSQGKFNQGVNNRRKAEYYLYVNGKYTRYSHNTGEYTEI